MICLECCGYLTSTHFHINHHLEFGTLVTFKLLDLIICNGESYSLLECYWRSCHSIFATVQNLSCFASTRLICLDDFCFCRQAFCGPSLSASLFNFLGSAPIFLSHGLDSFRRTRRFSLSPFRLLVGSVQAILPNPPSEVPIPLLLFGSAYLIFMLLACAVFFAGDQSCLEACGW